MALKEKPPAGYSLLAGGIAGAVEATITYPTEYVKTRLQLQQSHAGAGKNVLPGKAPLGPLEILFTTVRTQGFFTLYTGVSALIIGNAAKAAVRFLTYDQIANALKDEHGKLTVTRSLWAGLGAGVCEAVLVVTPMETIKTKLIDDRNRPKPQYRGLVHGTTQIIKIEGFSGIYRGLFPVVARQGANSMVRFSVYSNLRSGVISYSGKKTLPAWMTFGIGSIAGIVTVYTTMPIDVVKTKMQGLDARTKYSNSFDCAIKVARTEGIRAFWSGATPRLARLIFSGGIVFTIYEEVMKGLLLFRPPNSNALNQ